MFERFTDKARGAVTKAKFEARALHHDRVGTEHIVLGIMDEPVSVGARMLAELGFSVDIVRGEIQELVPVSEKPSKRLPFSKNATHALEAALREAMRFGHNHIGTEHILLGILVMDGSLGARIVRKYGVTLERMRERVATLPDQELALASGDMVAAARARAAGELERVQQKAPPGPLCPGCHRSLLETLVCKTVEAPNDSRPGVTPVNLVYCEGCGHVLGSHIAPEVE